MELTSTPNYVVNSMDALGQAKTNIILYEALINHKT